MLNVYLGNFHPDLEDALCQHIAEIKKKDQLSQIAIVTPSDHIRKRLKTLLTIERGMCLMGVHFLTFHTLSLKLYEEKYGLMSQKMSHMICDDFFFTEMIRHILGTDAAETNLFRHFAETPEGCSAIWRTIRELREARVEPDNMIEAIRDGLFDGEDYEKIIALLVIYIRTEVMKALYSFLECGIPENGMARVRCEECGHDFFVAYSCRCRVVCPSCSTKRSILCTSPLPYPGYYEPI